MAIGIEFPSFIAGCKRAEEIYIQHKFDSFEKNIEMGHALCADSRRADGALAFRKASEIGPHHCDALNLTLQTELAAGVPIADRDLQSLERFDSGKAKYIRALMAQKNGADPKEVLRELGDGFEAFDTGGSGDWLFLRMVAEAVPNAPKPEATAEASTVNGHYHSSSHGSAQTAKPNLFFYWDKDTPPSEVEANFEYHTKLGIFDVKPFSKTTASDFLSDYYGRDTVDLFRKLRHPSEESDFFRFHAIYALGGFYLDVDEQIISVGAFRDQIGAGLVDTYVISGSGPVESAFFGGAARSPVIAEAIRALTINCYVRPDLSMWLKTGPGPITRALSRVYHRHLKYGEALPPLRLLPPVTFANFLRAVPVSYRGDARDWRVFEATRD